MSPEQERYHSLSPEMLGIMRSQAEAGLVYVARLIGGTQYAVYGVLLKGKNRMLLVNMLCGSHHSIVRGVEIDLKRQTATPREPTDAELTALSRRPVEVDDIDLGQFREIALAIAGRLPEQAVH